MKKVYKYEIEHRLRWALPKTTVTIPADSTILDIGFQADGSNTAMEDGLFLWAIVDTLNEKMEEIELEIYGTGWEIEEPNVLRHLKTIHHRGYVWHVFKRNN